MKFIVFELGISSFNSYVHHLTRGFIASTRAFNLLTCAFNLPTRAFNLPTRAFNLATRAFNLATRAFSILTREFELLTRVLLFHGKQDILRISKSKFDEVFQNGNILIDGFSTPYRLDRDSKGGGIMLYVRGYTF